MPDHAPTPRYVFIDPDGTARSTFGVVIEHPTGVRYVCQCGGTDTLERAVEGYLVPVGGQALDTEEKADWRPLRVPFHWGRACVHGGAASDPEVAGRARLPDDQLAVLRRAVATIPWWSNGGVGDASRRQALALDETRLAEIVEGWVPVATSDGPGILLWPNCD